MASVYICTKPYSEVEYSITDGSVRSFVLRGETLYDTDVSAEGWKQKLAELVREFDLDKDRRGIGLHAFVYKLQDEGLLAQ